MPIRKDAPLVEIIKEYAKSFKRRGIKNYRKAAVAAAHNTKSKQSKTKGR